MHKYYAYGIRNSFGLTIDPLTGYLWQTENGPDTYDEINVSEPGFNSGWIKSYGPFIKEYDHGNYYHYTNNISNRQFSISKFSCPSIMQILYLAGKIQ